MTAVFALPSQHFPDLHGKQSALFVFPVELENVPSRHSSSIFDPFVQGDIN